MTVATPVADKYSALENRLMPKLGTEGSGAMGTGRAYVPPKATAAQMTNLAAKNMQDTNSTFGTHEMPLSNGGMMRAVVSTRAGNSRGANRGSHLKTQYVYRAPDGEWKAITSAEALSLLGEK
jgi:hypothetical protein